MAFALKVILSFLIGGGYVSGIIWFSEKLGSRVGGALTGVPNTVLVSLVFINVTENPQATKLATSIIPVMLIAVLLYAWVFVKTASLTNKNRHLFATATATMAWLLAAAVLRQSFSKAGFVHIVIFTLVGIMLFQYIFHTYAVILPKKRMLPNSIYIVRFLVAGAVIATAVVAARYLGPLWGGVISGFPATVVAVLYFLSKSQGGEFAKSFVKQLPLSVISSLIFVVVLHQTLTRVSTYISFLIGMACALIYTLVLLSVRKSEAATHE